MSPEDDEQRQISHFLCLRKEGRKEEGRKLERFTKSGERKSLLLGYLSNAMMDGIGSVRWLLHVWLRLLISTLTERQRGAGKKRGESATKNGEFRTRKNRESCRFTRSRYFQTIVKQCGKLANALAPPRRAVALLTDSSETKRRDDGDDRDRERTHRHRGRQDE